MAGGRIAIGSDHAGLGLKAVLVTEMSNLGYKVDDLGTSGAGSVDYPDYADRVAEALAAGWADRGVLVCGTGIGMSMAANRHRHVRAAVCHDAVSARLTRAHNDANVLCLGARLIGEEVAKDCLRVFLATPFEGGRHAARVAKFA
ncbi:MAG: ribose 5-phosphate isomerase B [Alphaproteobacteria bacterium]|nr:ribose 5-phosphate isomerase B [Alphaproteobacteria bacterium]